MPDDAHLLRRALLRRITTVPDEPAASNDTRPSSPAPAEGAPRYRALARRRTTIPVAMAEEPPRASITRRAKRPRCALVVEGDRAIGQHVARVLDELGWRVVETPTLEGARVVLDAVVPDLVLIDFDFSEEYASALDELRYARRMAPTVLVSASPLAIDAARVHGLALLQKPFATEALIETVERVVRPDMTVMYAPEG